MMTNPHKGFTPYDFPHRDEHSGQLIGTKTGRGFTLVEMIVSIGLFALVMLVATSAYFNLIALDRRARATNQVANNLSFAVDSMVRGIRTGGSFQCLNGSPDANGNSTSGSCTQFAYTDTNYAAGNNVITYYLSGNQVLRAQGLSASASGGIPLTDPSITITGLTFFVRGAGNTNDTQPQVLFTMKGTLPADSSGNVATFVIEEDATQRLIDF